MHLSFSNRALVGVGSTRQLCTAMSIGLAIATSNAWAQNSIDASGPIRIESVVLEHDQPTEPNEALRKLEANVRQAVGIYPGRSYDRSEIDLALARLKSRGLVAAAQAELRYAEDGGTALVISLRAADAKLPTPHWSDSLKLVDDGQRLLKLRVGLKGALAVSGNQWFDNGQTLTQFNPRGRYGGGRGPNGVLDLAPSVGLTGAMPLQSGAQPAYLYGNVLYLGTLSMGQDNNRSDTRSTGQWEEAYVGVVDSGVTERGTAWRANLSYGRQSYCIGNGMLLCQIASSGGDRGADFAWPRWTGDRFLKAQLRVNHSLLEAFRFEPNDFPSTHTQLAGVNLDYDNSRGQALGFTWVTARKGQLQYYLPTGESYAREGLRAWHMRGAWKPEPGKSGFVAKAEYARQTHSDFDMRATGYSAEGGWQLASHSWRPMLTYRHSSTTGDDPATRRYERWDLLYSGNDIDTWVQGQLMKNIHYNSNVQVHRLMLRATPDPRWRWTAALSTYRADTRNNIGGVISNLAGKNLGSEILLVAEHFATRNVYWRFTAAALWPGSGVTHTLPMPVAKPWLVGIVQFNISY